MFFSKMMEMNDKINATYEDEKIGYTIALIGNPNVGKSTVFNELTGLKQHTGNWPGKTVDLARGYYTFENRRHEIVDLPGTYSLQAHSNEEEVTRDFICFESCDVSVIVCDSTCLERNLNLVLQTLEITRRVVVVLNLSDEAKKKQIEIDDKKLRYYLDCEVVKMSARNAQGFKELKKAINRAATRKDMTSNPVVNYDIRIEHLMQEIGGHIDDTQLDRRFLSLKLLDPHADTNHFYQHLAFDTKELKEIVQINRKKLINFGLYDNYEELIVTRIQEKANRLSEECIIVNNQDFYDRDRRIDRIITNKFYGVLLMLALLAVIFWITISGANIPSAMLAELFANIQVHLNDFIISLNSPEWLRSFLMDGIYLTLANVVSVMLPPMAIFFPLFTILEDLGYLPRIAFNLDGYFHKAHACGKQALTMCMGFGCNAVGVIGCRIIDSPRERLIAILTNNFVPCNGRFPTLIAIITMFFTSMFIVPWNGIFSTVLLTGVILLGIILTFITSKILSLTILKGLPSSFTLELPPYRKPQFAKVLVRSICDRTLFVLARAIRVAIPAGAFIWLLANINIEGISLLSYAANFLDPLAQLMGLDGVILLAFILGFPANEIVIPIMIMAYMSTGHMMELSDLNTLKVLLLDNGWTWITALCTMIFSLVHFPCATSLLTIKKETKSWKWTFMAFMIPTVFGIILCTLIANISRLVIYLL